MCNETLSGNTWYQTRHIKAWVRTSALPLSPSPPPPPSPSPSPSLSLSLLQSHPNSLHTSGEVEQRGELRLQCASPKSHFCSPNLPLCVLVLVPPPPSLATLLIIAVLIRTISSKVDQVSSIRHLVWERPTNSDSPHGRDCKCNWLLGNGELGIWGKIDRLSPCTQTEATTDSSLVPRMRLPMTLQAEATTNSRLVPRMRLPPTLASYPGWGYHQLSPCT